MLAQALPFGDKTGRSRARAGLRQAPSWRSGLRAC